jgi:hypothetical protein
MSEAGLHDAHAADLYSRIEELEAQLAEVERREKELRHLTEDWALEIVERIEKQHNELQRLGLTERESSEASRKMLSSMATDAVYLAALIREVRATLRALEEVE